jgi:hypothetical protein
LALRGACRHSWALRSDSDYKVDGVFSESFPTHAEALAAARAAAEEQEIPGHTETIEYEDDKGKWHTETASGRDRPHAVVKDSD